MNWASALNLFSATFFKMLELLLFVLIGFVVSKRKLVPEGSERVLSKLETWVFIPALALDCFLKQFTLDTLENSWKIIVFAAIVSALGIPLAIILSKFFSNENYIRRIYAYCICFSNFGFVGKAVVKGVFPESFSTYLIYLLPLEIMLYAWGIPVLLMNQKMHKGLGGIVSCLKNPSMICVLVGAVLGILGVHAYCTSDSANFVLSHFYGTITNIVSVCGNCMSPVAMLLTGMTFASISFKEVVGTKRIYVVSILRLLIIPIVFGIVFKLLNLPKEFVLCAICALSMPLGLNSIVIPAAFGYDTTESAGMTLVSHTLSMITIPIIFSIFLS